MRFLLFVCVFCSTFAVTTLYASATPQPGCATSTSGQLVIPPAQSGLLLINEVMLLPHHAWTCVGSISAPAVASNWLELYNPQNQAFDLYAARSAIDGGPNTTPMWLPFGASIAPHGFLVIFPGSNLLFKNTETFARRLLINGTVIDQVTLPMLGLDQSYARIPDGTPLWQVCNTPSIDTSNDQCLMPSVAATATRTRGRHTTTPTTTTKRTTTKRATKGKSTAGQGVTGSNSTSSDANSSANVADGQPVTADGTQPAWSALQLPTDSASSPQAATSTSTAADNTTAASSPVVSNDNADLPRKILLTSLALLLACVLFLGWRRFRSP